jgi:tetratricopeptide (TPR) repeat protein
MLCAPSCSDRIHYIQMDAHKRLFLMLHRFTDITEGEWTESQYQSLLNAFEKTDLSLEENIDPKKFIESLYSKWLASTEEYEQIRQTFSELNEEGLHLCPIHQIILELIKFKASGYSSKFLDAVFTTLDEKGVDLGQIGTTRSIINTFLDESKMLIEDTLPAIESSHSPSKNKKKKTRRQRKNEYWAIRAKSNRLSESTKLAGEQLVRKSPTIETLEPFFDIFKDHQNEIEDTRLELSLLESMAGVSLRKRINKRAARKCVEYSKRLFTFGRVQTAYEWMSQIAEASPDHSENRNNLGFVLLFRGELDRAQNELNRSSSLKFDSTVHWINLGIVEALLKNYADAEDHFRTALEVDNDNSVAAELVLLANHKAVGELTSRRVVLTGGSAKAITLCNLAYVLYRSGQDGVVETFYEAIDTEKSLSYPHRAAGWYYHELEQNRKSVHHFQTARKLEPKHPLNEWETQLLPKYYFYTGGRNELCECGSGKKFKNCCQMKLN